jgi:hypothetical protein
MAEKTQDKAATTFGEVVTLAENKARQGDLRRMEEAEAEQGKNRDFVQLSRRTMDELGRLVSRAPGAMRLLMVIGKRMGRTNALVASYETLGKLAGMSESSVKRSVKVLKDERWITTLRVGSATAYVVNANVLWTSHATLKVASFAATIVTTSDENPESAAEGERLKLKHFPFVEPGERAVLAGDPPEPPAMTDQLDLA